MIMTERFKILAKYIKDMSSETPDVETYITAGNNMDKYKLDIDIKSIALKKSHFEIVYAIAIKIDESIKEKKDLEKIVLCDVPNCVVSDIEKSFTDMMHNSGFPNIKLEKKIDFTKLYLERFN